MITTWFNVSLTVQKIFIFKLLSSVLEKRDRFVLLITKICLFDLKSPESFLGTEKIILN